MESLKNFWSKLTSCGKQPNPSLQATKRIDVRPGFNQSTIKNLELDDLVRLKTFAQGSWGEIDLVHIKNEPRHCFALKKLRKSKLKSNTHRRHVFNEKNILSSIKSDFVIKFYGTFQDRTHLYILTECCLGGDLFNKVPFSESCSRFLVGCITEALDYLHLRNIVHRDLKLENLVLDGQGYLKVIDFGLAKKLKQFERTYSFCGSLEYCAPEMVARSRKGHDVAVDLWALGMIVYEFMFGKNPIHSADREKMMARIRGGIELVPFPKNASKRAVDFIQNLCRTVPHRRLGYGFGGFDHLRNHCWIRGFDWQALRKRSLKSPVVPTITSCTDTRNFNQRIKVEEDEDPQDADFDQDWAKDF